ncbi:MAG: hypothetical protein ACREL6_00575, partial [Gemmatimonadales bacterium]
MKTGLGQYTGMRQELRINPRLYQAMDMLYMPMLDLQQHLKQELLVNPFLELLEPEEEEGQDQAAKESEEKEDAKQENETDWEEILLNGFDVGGAREQYEEREYIEPVSVETPGLTDYLREQLKHMELSPRQLLLAEEFLGNINDDGYLVATAEEILAGVNALVRSGIKEEEPELDDFGNEVEPEEPGETDGVEWYTMEEIEEMMHIIQRLDPPGIGCRDLRECLLLQLVEREETGTLTYRLVNEAFDDLLAHRWNDLARRFGADPRQVQTAADSLGQFDPKPGLKFSSRDDGYITPDLIVDKIDGRYHVFLNDTGYPRLRLSRSYQELARDKKKLTPENREFIATKMNSANWMIQALEQRRQT